MSKSALDKLRKFLSRDFREQMEKRHKLRKVLSKLRDQEKALQTELQDEPDTQQQRELQTRIRLLHEQRRKGLELLRQLRQARRPDAPDQPSR